MASLIVHPSKTHNAKRIFTGLTLVLSLIISQHVLAGTGPAPLDLGSAAHFAILSGAAITTTGGGIIVGDVGASPIAGSAIALTSAQVNGIIYVVDATGPAGSFIDPARLTVAKGDLTTAYNDAAGRTPVPSGPFLNPGSGNIGGLVLVPGLYKFTGTATISGADLTLTGGPNDVWIFQIAADLIVANGMKVTLAGGAQAQNVFWQVGTSATIGTFAEFKGTILADQSIIMDTSSTMEGRALARIAGVTFNGNAGGMLSLIAPRFTQITKETSASESVVLSLSPNKEVILQISSDLLAADWVTLATNTPVTSIWSFTNNAAGSATQRFYRAILTE